MSRTKGRTGTLKRMIKTRIKEIGPNNTFYARELAKQLEPAFGEELGANRVGVTLASISAETGAVVKIPAPLPRGKKGRYYMWKVTNTVVEL